MERDIEKELVRCTKVYGGMCAKLAILGKRNFPDRTILLPKGFIVFVELKDTGKDLRKTQRWFSKLLIKLGFRFYCINDLDQIINIFEEYDSYLESLKNAKRVKAKRLK